MGKCVFIYIYIYESLGYAVDGYVINLINFD